MKFYFRILTEIAQPEIRGAFFQLFITIGILYANVFGYVLNMVGYRIACGVVLIVLGILFIFQPESPFYFLKINEPEKAEESFRKLRGKEYGISTEMKQMQDQIVEKNQRV